MKNIMKLLTMKAIAAGAKFPEASISRAVELMQLKILLDQERINCALDVGANKGQFASDLRGIGYSGSIISFEPLSREFGPLSESFKNDPQWRGVQLALGNFNGSATINILPELTGWSSILQPATGWRAAETEKIEVRRLDEVLGGLLPDSTASRVLLKMDTQGYDLSVFEGAKGCLPLICALQSELSVVPLYKGMPHYIEALTAYEAQGFDLFHLAVESRSKGSGLQEMNCLMRRNRNIVR